MFNGFTNVDASWLRLVADTAPGLDLASLAQVRVSGGRAARTLGPTAASKLLYALRPAVIMPWDAAIATRMYGVRDGAAFGRHLRLGRAWARTIIAETGADETTLPELIGRPGISLAKILDEHLYVTITLAARISGADRAGQAGQVLEG